MRGRILGVLRALDDHAARRPVLAGLAIAAAVAIAAVAWFGSAALGGRFLLDTSLGQDIYHLSALYERHAHYALGGRFPFWLPEFQGGVAAPATWMYGLLYPPVLLFGLIPAQLAWSWLAVLHLALAAGGMFALVFDERRDVTGAATAAALFALSELMVGRVLCGHLNLVLAIAWIPWVLWLVGRAVAGRPGAVAWLGLVTGVGLVSGHVQIWFYAGPLVGLHAVVRASHAPRPLAAIGRAAVGLALGVGVAAIQWVPSAELFLLGERAAPDVRDWTLPGHLLASKIAPGFLGHRPATYWGLDPYEHEYLATGGLAILFLASMALRRPDRARWAWLGVVVLGVLAALGPSTPLGRLLESLPLISSGRTPGRALLLAVIGLSVLAGHGVAAFRTAAPDERRTLLAAGAWGTGALALVAGIGLVVWIGGLPDRVPSPAGAEALSALVLATGLPAVLRAVGGLVLLVGALLLAPRLPAPRILVPLAALLATLLSGTPPAGTTDPGYYDEDWSARLPDGAREHRVFLLNSQSPNLERSGVRTLRSLCHVEAPWFERFLEQRTIPHAGWLDLAAQIGPPRVRPGGTPEYGPWELDVHPLPALGPALLLPTAQGGIDDAEALRRLATGERLLLLADPPPPRAEGARAPGDRVSLDVRRGDDPHVLDVDYTSPRPAWLFLSEKYYPGWQATLDGEPVPRIYRANVAFRAVPVPAGRHTLRMEYVPGSVRLGSALSLAALTGCLLLGLRSRWRPVADAARG